MKIEVKDLKKLLLCLNELDYVIIETIECKNSREYIIRKTNCSRVCHFFSGDWLFQIVMDKWNKKYYAIDIEHITKLDNLNQIIEVFNLLK